MLISARALTSLITLDGITMENDINDRKLFAEGYDIESLFESAINADIHPHEVFNLMLQTFTDELSVNGYKGNAISEILEFTRRATDFFIASEFEISY